MPSAERILGVAFFNGSVEEAVERHLSAGGTLVVPASPALVKLNYDQAYRGALQQADLVLPDSELLVLLWRILTARRLRKISGIDYLNCLISSSSFQEDRNVFWVLPSEAARDKASDWLRKRNLRIDGYTFHILPPNVVSAQHPLLFEVEQKKPRHIVIALRGGGQEELGVYLRDYLLYRPAIHCVGAALGFLTGDEDAIPEWAQRHHLGWLARLASQPRMLLPRMAIAVSVAAMVLRYRSELPRLRTRWSDL
jgi:exopolysaccharide biosynthesis WecB/TagA/CpsF family protein